VRLSDLSIKKPVFAWMLMGALIVFGTIGASRLGVSKMPDVDFPQVSVDLTLEGAAPEVMETDVVDVVEDACMTVEGILDVRSSARQGSATVTIEFELGRDIDAALQDVQTKIAQAQRRLPREMDPPVVTKTNPEDQPILWVALSGPHPPQVLSDLARYVVKERLQTVPGVGEVMMGGYRERNVRVWVDADRLNAVGLTVGDVLAALRREHLELPSGRLESDAREVNVRTLGEAMDLAQFREIVIAERWGKPTRLKDVAVVEDGLEDRRRIARALGLPAQGLGVKKQRGANAVSVADGVRARFEEIRKALPEDVLLGVNFDGTAPVKEAVREIGFTMVLAVLLTALVCWLFLGSLSSTVNVLLAIPTSIVGTFAAMYFLGFTFNTFTLLGLSLAVGIVVDDAIMVLENIFRHAEAGEGRIRAAVAGAREIAFAAMAATAAIVAIFLPVAFMKGIIGAFFFQFGVTLSVCVLLSLLEALTLTPSRCGQFLSVGKRRTRFGRAVDGAFEGLARAYRASLPFVLRRRSPVLAAGAALFFGSLLLLRGMKREMTPSQDIGILLARIQTPVGSSVDATDRVLRECERILSQRPEVQRYFGAVGGFGGGEVTTGVLFVTLVPREKRRITLEQFRGEIRVAFNAIPGMLRANIQDLSIQDFSASRGYPVEFTVQGPDWEKLASYSEAILGRMRESGLYVDLDTDYLVGMPEVQVIPDRARAASMGVSMEEVAETVNGLIGGVRVGKFKDRGRRYDVRVRLLSGQRTRPEDIGRLQVRAGNGALVPLSSLVRLEERPSLLKITRRGRGRAIGIFANVAPERSQADAIAEVRRIASSLLPPPYRVALGGSAQTMEESFRQLLFALGLGVVVAYMILASQFNSFAHPVTVLVALPFSLTGALLALRVTGLSLNLYSFIGIILLMGIVKKNSILLVDFVNQRRLLGESRDEALLHACPVRLRPILMTSVSTIAGALPAALAAGPGGELRQPMAVAVVGGLAVSTFLTLFVVPALYSLLDSVTSRVGQAAQIERETGEVIADLQAEEIEGIRTRGRARAPAPPARREAPAER
jgi:hydrophobe/amphiphile efflux-1 (HAE1) family protein